MLIHDIESTSSIVTKSFFSVKLISTLLSLSPTAGSSVAASLYDVLLPIALGPSYPSVFSLFSCCVGSLNDLDMHCVRSNTKFAAEWIEMYVSFSNKKQLHKWQREVIDED